MQKQCSKDENEPSYDNVQTTVRGNTAASKTYRIKLLVTRPLFKWTLTITILATLAVVIVVPTALEVTREGNISSNKIILVIKYV